MCVYLCMLAELPLARQQGTRLFYFSMYQTVFCPYICVNIFISMHMKNVLEAYITCLDVCDLSEGELAYCCLLCPLAVLAW